MRLLIAAVACSAIVACTATGGSKQMAGLSADAQKMAQESGASTADGPKVSLDELTDKYRTVTLVDDKTGKPKIICRRLRQPGTLFANKVCKTREEWIISRRVAKETSEQIQRNTNPGIAK